MDPRLVTLCLGGGLFAIMVFIHMFVDFVCQTHFEAMNKHNNWKIRARHCGIYALGFIPLLVYLSHIGALTGLEYFFALNILFWSHFVEDTYYPVYLWAKYIRRPEEMTKLSVCTISAGEALQLETVDGAILIKNAKMVADPKVGFLQFINTTLGKILMIAIDQIIHFCFLFPIVWMALN